MTHTENLVLFGITGDLSRRMLLPSLYHLDRDGLLPEGLKIVGAARGKLDAGGLRDLAKESLEERKEKIDEAAWQRFTKRLHYVQVDATQAADFKRLATMVGEKSANLFFLALSPDIYIPVCLNLKNAGLATENSRIIIEKPVGHDLESAREINKCLVSAFGEHNVFRIDHYLGKETVQNLLALRFANVMFEPLWNRSSIDHVQITVAEEVGMEGRWNYYNDFGALRDMVQNHILQLVCLVAMEPPAHLDPNAVRDEKVKVLHSLRPIRGREASAKTVRAQYEKGTMDGEKVPGYEEEAGGKESDTETFVAIEAEIENWRWSGVPFYLRTGKRLGNRRTEIVIQFLPVPHSVFAGEAKRDLIPNRLTITLQPDEQISLQLMNKSPDLAHGGMRLNPLSLNLTLPDALKKQLRRIAYERLLLDAMAGDPTLFVRGDEVEAAWTWIDGIEDGWKQAKSPMETYAAGSDGPDEANDLIARRGYSWAN